MNDNFNNQNGFNNQNNMGMGQPMGPQQPMMNNNPQPMGPMGQPMNQQMPQQPMNQPMGMGPQQPMMNNYQPQMPAGEKKNNKTLIIIIVAVLGVLVVGLGVYFATKGNKSSGTYESYEDILKREEEEEAKLNENYTAEAYYLEDGSFVIKVKNDNKVGVNGSIKVDFYDTNEQLVNTEDGFIFNLGPGRTAYEDVYLAYDEKEFATYKVVVKLTKAIEAKYYEDQLTINTNETESNLMIQVTNNSDEKVKSVGLVVLFYGEDDKLIGYKETSLSDINSKETSSDKVTWPRDDNYDKLNYTRYEVVVNYAYSSVY